jgi:hypothetical protein
MKEKEIISGTGGTSSQIREHEQPSDDDESPPKIAMLNSDIRKQDEDGE